MGSSEHQATFQPRILERLEKKGYRVFEKKSNQNRPKARSRGVIARARSTGKEEKKSCIRVIHVKDLSAYEK